MNESVTNAERHRRRAGVLVTWSEWLTIGVCSVMLTPTASLAQFSVEMSYGVDRTIQSSSPELDGWFNVTLDWISASGLGFGIGTDHQFESAALDPSEHEGWAIYLSPSFERPLGLVAPFVRAGLGLGRAPCQGDTCGDGAYVRGSAGVRIRLVEKLRILGEIGVSRVSRPFSGAGVSIRF